MAYREETEALRARIERLEASNRELEWELTKARSKAHASSRPPPRDDTRVQELEAQNRSLHWDLAAMKVKARMVSSSPERATETSFFGIPKRIEEERELDVELAAEGHAALRRALEEHFGDEGMVESSPTSLAWRNGERGEALVIVRDGRTRMRIVDGLTGLRAPPWNIAIAAAVVIPLLVRLYDLSVAGALFAVLAQTNLLILLGIRQARLRVAERRRRLTRIANELEPIIRHHGSGKPRRAHGVRLDDEDPGDNERVEERMMATIVSRP